MKEQNYLENLNEKQREAVLCTEGPLLILAGAGAGKTKTITYRIFHLIKQGVNPSEILAITFTNKAAKEMKTRTLDLLGADTNLSLKNENVTPFISTFHSLGVYIIKENAEVFGLPRHFTIFDKDDSKKALKQAMENLKLDPKEEDAGKILSIISKEKSDGVSFGDFANKESFSFIQKKVAVIWEEYENILKKEKALDFDDLLIKTLWLLKKEDKREYYNNKWKYIHIDEYQDTNRVQYEIVKLLANKYKNIAVVGDIDQSIYSWRGADFKNILRFEKDYPEVKNILLEQNYRSTKNIIEASNRIIEKNQMRKEKNLFTLNDTGDKITLHSEYTERDEASYIARTVKNLIKQNVDPSEIAILYRANFQSRAIEEAFLRNEVPYTILGTKFFERKEVKDVLAYLKASLNPDGIASFKRAIENPKRGIGEATLLKIFEGREDDLPPKTKEKIERFKNLLQEIKSKIEILAPSEVIKFIIKESGLENSLLQGKTEDIDRLENIREIASIAKMFDQLPIGEGMEKFLEHVSLSSDQDELSDEKKGARLMTIHASKGLEFDYVFITGLEENLFPHKRIGENRISKEEEEEERRLFYVALTRARKKVYLTYSNVRTIFGSTQFNTPSEFTTDIDDNLLDIESEEINKDREKIVYLDLDDLF